MGSDTSSRRQIPAIRTTEGTHPAGSEWTRNPIPDRDYYFSGPLGLSGHGPFSWNIIDEYRLPELADGDYTLSWRWDCEGSQQVWANCADITIIGGSPAPPPAQRLRQSQRLHRCPHQHPPTSVRSMSPCAAIAASLARTSRVARRMVVAGSLQAREATRPGATIPRRPS